MEILIAENAGFCFGVERAYQMVLDSYNDESIPKPIYTLGCLIHNERVVNQLKKMGIGWVNNIQELPEGTCGSIVIRSHGEPPEVVSELIKKGWNIIDATCPFVKKAQNNSKLLYDEDYQVIIFGDETHPEVIGILGYTNNTAKVISEIDELNNIKINDKVGLLAQTTKNITQFLFLAEELLPMAKEVRVFNTICTVTKLRQKAAIDLAQKVDVMLVVGGKNSSNTGNLYQSCKKTGTATYHIEGSEDIDPQWFSRAKRVGVTAGASTQQWIIKEVEEFMGEMTEKGNHEETKELANHNSDAETNVEEINTNQQEVLPSNEQTSPGDEIHPMDTPEALGYNKSLKEFHKGMVLTGKVVEVQNDGVFVDVGYKTEGFIPLYELSAEPIDSPQEVFQPGQEIEVVFLGTGEDGQIKLSKRKADLDSAWAKILEAQKNESILTGEVTKVVKGGLVVDVGLRGFIPASQIAIEYIEDLNQFVGQTIEMKIIEIEKKNNNVVLSRKKVLEERQNELKQQVLSNINIGDIVNGTVTKIVDFGAFVDIGGVEGLLHISEMSWARIEHPSKVISEGEEIDVKILNINPSSERISLGLKQVLPDPWNEFVTKYKVGDTIEGQITKIVSFGAFMEIEDGIEGLIHISQLSRRHVESPDEIVKKNDRVTAKIININTAERRVGLSLKELEADTHKKEIEKIMEDKDEGNITIGDIVGDIFNKKY